MPGFALEVYIDLVTCCFLPVLRVVFFYFSLFLSYIARVRRESIVSYIFTKNALSNLHFIYVRLFR